jgi:hypothetical protein
LQISGISVSLNEARLGQLRSARLEPEGVGLDLCREDNAMQRLDLPPVAISSTVVVQRG